jgi:hypothetical protein
MIRSTNMKPILLFFWDVTATTQKNASLKYKTSLYSSCNILWPPFYYFKEYPQHPVFKTRFASVLPSM